MIGINHNKGESKMKTYMIPGMKKPVSEKTYKILLSRNPDLMKEGMKTTTCEGRMIPISKNSKPKKTNKNQWIELAEKAHKAGLKAAEDCVPTPMVVAQHANPLDDSSPVTKAWHVPSGVCGFAWVNVKYKGAGAKFLNALKKQGLAGDINDHCEWRKDSYYGGYTHWVHVGGQSYEIKCAYASAYANVLNEAGIKAYSMSRLD